MRRRARAVLVAVGLVAALLGAACSSDDAVGGDTDTTGGGRAAQLQPAPGFDGTTLRIGSLGGAGSPLAALGEAATAGSRAYFEYVNTQGGVAGQYPIELVEADAPFDPGELVMYVQVAGPPVADPRLDELAAQAIVVVPASLDARWVAEPNLLPVGVPYQLQAINAIDWYYSDAEHEGDRLCTIASEDGYGDAGVEGVAFIADALEVDVTLESRFPSPSGREGQSHDFAGQVRELEDAECDLVFAVATLFDTEGLATAFAGRPDFTPTVIGQSPTWTKSLAANEWIQEHFLLASEGPAYGDTTVPGMQNLITVQQEYAPDVAPDIYFNFGYVQAVATVALLEKAVDLGDLSREGLANALEELGTVDFGGLTGDYTYGPPEDRVPPIRSSIFKPDPDAATYPTGLELVEQDYEADAAADYEYGSE